MSRYHVTGQRYSEPASLDRIREAAIDWMDADSEDDADFQRRRCRLNAAINARVDSRVERKLRLLFRFCDVKKLAGHYKPKASAHDPRQAALPFRSET